MPGSAIDFDVFKRHSLVREAIAEIVPGMQDLAHIDVAKKEFHIKNRLIHTPDFNTPSGKAQFKVNALPERRARPGGFTLSTLRSEGQFNSIIYEERDTYRGTKTRWCVMMNQEDISALGLNEGDIVNVSSAQGQMQAVTLYEFDLPRGDVLAYYPEANILTSTAVDPRSQTPAFKSTPVEIVPA